MAQDLQPGLSIGGDAVTEASNDGMGSEGQPINTGGKGIVCQEGSGDLTRSGRMLPVAKGCL